MTFAALLFILVSIGAGFAWSMAHEAQKPTARTLWLIAAVAGIAGAVVALSRAW